MDIAVVVINRPSEPYYFTRLSFIDDRVIVGLKSLLQD